MDRSSVSKHVWQYSLRRLVLATFLAPPLLALLVYVSIWAWYAAPSILPAFREYVLPIGAVLALALTGLALFWAPPGNHPAVQMKLWQSIALAGAQFLALWPWYFAIAHLGGWILIWGDNRPLPYLNELVAVMTAALTGISTLRLAFGLTTLNYTLAHIGLVAALLLLGAPFSIALAMRWLS